MREEEFLNLIFDNLSPKYNLIVDIGAGGQPISVATRIVDKGYKGILFEPHPGSYSKLVERYKTRNDIIILNKAVSDTEGTMNFYLNKNPGLSSLEVNVHFKDKKVVEVVKIVVVKIGSELKRLDIPADFDILKVDAEGQDYAILKNMFEESNFRPQIIMHEISHPGPEEFKKLVEGYEYTLISKGPQIGDMIYRRAK